MKNSLRRMALVLLVLPVATSAAPFMQSRIEVVYGPMADVALLSQLKQGHIGEKAPFAMQMAVVLQPADPLADDGEIGRGVRGRILRGVHRVS